MKDMKRGLRKVKAGQGCRVALAAIMILAMLGSMVVPMGMKVNTASAMEVVSVYLEGPTEPVTPIPLAR